MRILLCDDSKIIIALFRLRLKELDVQIVGEAQNGQDGYDLFMKLKPDLMFLDITMPIKDGKSCLKEIRDKVSNSRIIIVSAVTDPRIVDECYKLGAIGFMPKVILNRHNEFINAFSIINQNHKSAS